MSGQEDCVYTFLGGRDRGFRSHFPCVGALNKRVAQEKYGKGKPITGEQMKWGLENLNLDEKRLKQIGAFGLMSPLKSSCADHEGGGAVKFQQWGGAKWVAITDWIQPDKSIVRPMVEEAAAKYAKEKNVTPRKC